MMEWNQVGSFDYFLPRTTAPIWYALSFAINCAGAITVESLASLVARIGIRTGMVGYN